MNFKHYLFDLDGTLTDSSPGIVNSVLYALKMTGAPVLPREKLMAFLGPPLIDSFRNYCGASEEEAQELLRHYRKYYAEKGILENALYAGIPELLDALHRSGVSIYMATSKPEYFARQIVDHFGLSRYFAFIGGSFNKTGGHNPLEATVYSKPAITRPSIHNFRDIYWLLSRSAAGKIVKNPKELSDYIEKLLSDKAFYNQACKDCETVFNDQQGALDVVINELKILLNK